MADNTPKPVDAATIEARRKEFIGAKGIGDDLFNCTDFDIEAAKAKFTGGLLENSLAPKVKELTAAAAAAETKRIQTALAQQLGITGDEAAKLAEADLLKQIADLKAAKAGASAADKAAIDKEVAELKTMLTAAQNEAKVLKSQVDALPAEKEKWQAEMQQQMLMTATVAAMPERVRENVRNGMVANNYVLVPTENGKYYIAQRQKDGTLTRAKKTESTAFDNLDEFAVAKGWAQATDFQVAKPKGGSGASDKYKVDDVFAAKLNARR